MATCLSLLDQGVVDLPARTEYALPFKLALIRLCPFVCDGTEAKESWVIMGRYTLEQVPEAFATEGSKAIIIM